MNSLLNVVFTNAVVAAVLVAAILACKPWIKNPALLHLLWVFALLKLWMPPLWTPTVAWLPLESPAPATALSAAAVNLPHESPQVGMIIDPAAPAGDSVLDASPAAAVPPRSTVPAAQYLTGSLAAIWLAGTIVWLSLALRRIARFQRCLRFAQSADDELRQTAAGLAVQLGLRVCPRVRLVPGRVSPLLWAFFCSPQIVLPSELFAELDHEAREALLLHELAHYRRGDHWVRLLELFTLAAYWWHPLVWFVRREIRAAEEHACDAWVVSQRPDSRGKYATALVRTIAFLSGPGPDMPLLASGIGAKGDIESRLTAIMSATNERLVSRRAKAWLCALALAFLPLAPAVVRAQRSADETAKAAIEATIVAPAASSPAAEDPATKKEQDEAAAKRGFFVFPVTTELQRLKLGREVNACVVIDGQRALVSGQLNAAAIDLDGLKQAIAAAVKRGEKIHFQVVYDLLSSEQQLLMRPLGDLLTQTAESQGVTTSGTRVMMAFKWQEIVDHATTPAPAKDAIGVEKGEGDDKAMAYAVETPLSRVLVSGMADCYVDVLKPVTAELPVLSEALLGGIGKQIDKLKFKRRESVVFSMFSRETILQGRTTGNEPFNLDIKRAGRQLGFQHGLYSLRVVPTAVQKSAAKPQSQSESLVALPATVGLSGADAYESLARGFTEADAKYFETSRNAVSSEKRQIWLQYEAIEPYSTAMLELAKLHPNTETEFKCLLWVLKSPNRFGFPDRSPNRNSGAAKSNTSKDLAARELLQKYVDRKELAGCVESLAAFGSSAPVDRRTNRASKDLMPVLRNLMSKNPHIEVQGEACLLAWQISSYPGGHYRTTPGAGEKLTAVQQADRDQLYPLLAGKYAGVPHWRYGTIGEAAKRERFTLEKLAIGQVLPEIEGPDLDGTPMSLSDFRGKVVVLLFWSDGNVRDWGWLNQLTRDLDEKQFVALGVNTDKSQETAIQASAANKLTWRSWHDPARYKDWGLSRWPSLFILDRKGVIRYRDEDAGSLRRSVDKLLAEPE